MSTKIIELISDEQIHSAVDAWKLKADDSVEKLTRARDAALARCPFDRKDAAELVRQIEFGTRALREIASVIVNALVEIFDDVTHVILRLATSKHVEGRLGAIYSLSPNLPDDFSGGLLNDLLHDKSKKVREMALDWVGRNKKDQFLPLLKNAAEGERDSKLRNSFATEISLLERGYAVSRNADGIYVTVTTPLGLASGFVEIDNAEKLSDEKVAEIFRATRLYIEGAHG